MEETMSCITCAHLEKCDSRHDNEYKNSCSPIDDSKKFAKYEKADEEIIIGRYQKEKRREKLEFKFKLEMFMFTLIITYNMLYPAVIVIYTIYYAITNPQYTFGVVLLNTIQKMWGLIILDIIFRTWMWLETHTNK